MALRLVTDFVNTNIPGVYPKQDVKTIPVGTASSGVIALIGEAEGGLSFKDDVLKDNYFGPDALDQLEKKYLSGNLVESGRLLAAPSADDRIQGSASQYLPVKTNSGTKASFAIATPSGYGTYFSRNYGAPQNKYAVALSEVQEEVEPSFVGDEIDFDTPTALNGAAFTIRKQGAAAVTITLSNTTADHDTIAELVAEIQAQLPADMTASNDGDALILSMDEQADPEYNGYGLAFEIGGDAGDLLVLGLSAGLVSSSAEQVMELNYTNSEAGLNEFLELGGAIHLEVGYLGGTAVMTISSLGVLTTTGAATNLNIDLNNVRTLSELAELINAVSGFSASVPGTLGSRSPLVLDRVSALGISSTNAGVKPGRVKADAWDFNRRANEGIAISFTLSENAGLPKAHAKTFLSGGAKGATLAADIVDAFEALEGQRVNFVVPLFSRDASLDVAAGLTDASSTYTIDAINALGKTHILSMSTVKRKKNRQMIASFDGSYLDAKAKAGALSHARIAMTMQRVSQVNGVGQIVEYQPWAQAVIAAGMQCAGFYKGLVKKIANIISFKDPAGFDSGSPSQVENAIDSGILFMEKYGTINRWVSDQTTYGFDANFVFNSVQAVYAADLVALTLAESIDNRFVGESLADIDVATVLGFISQKMDELKRVKLVSGSKDAPLGYKNVKIRVSGPVMSIKIEVKLSTQVYFVPLEIQYSEVQLEGEL